MPLQAHFFFDVDGMRQKYTLFYVFALLLLIFFWRTVVFWFNNGNGPEANAGVVLYIALLGIELISFFLILAFPKKGRKNSSIHRVCFFWECAILIALSYNNASISQYVKCLAWPLFFESAYLFVRSDYSFLDRFRRMFFLFVLFGVVVFFRAMVIRDFGGQSNMIYFLVLPVPVILLTKNVRWRNIILILVTFFAVLSMKRSMILALALFWAIICCKFFLSSAKKGLAIALSFLVILAAFGTFRIVNNVTGGRLSSRLDSDTDDVTNGREAIYLVTWDMIVKSSPAHLVLGHGQNAVRADSILEVSAHNEFLEILYDYGLIALLVYFFFWGHLIKQWFFHYRYNTAYFIPYTLSICVFSVMALVSQLVLYVSYFLYLVMFWGMVEAATEIKECEIITSPQNEKI